MTGQKSVVLKTLSYRYADFMMVSAGVKDYCGVDIPAEVRVHPEHGEVKIFSGYRYGDNLEFRWSLNEDMEETDSIENILGGFGISDF